jgi:hypothetical protein
MWWTSKFQRVRKNQFLPGWEALEVRLTPSRLGVGLNHSASDWTGKKIFAPYIDMTAETQWRHTPYMVDSRGNPSLVATMHHTGLKYATLAFVNAKMVGGKVVPIWGSSGEGGITFDSPKGHQIMQQVAAAQQAGLNLIVSFGGIAACENNLEIGQLTASDMAAMKHAYEDVIGKFYAMGVRHFDFDIEGPANKSLPALENCRARFEVLKQIQNEPRFKGMQISFVLAISPTDGWAPNAWDGMFIKAAADSGIKVYLWNMMAFDYGTGVNNYMHLNEKSMVDALTVEADTGGNWQTGDWSNQIKGAADYLVDYKLAANRQEAFTKPGVTLMIGQDDATVVPNDPSPGYQPGDSDIVSTLSTTQVADVLAWANKNNIGMLSFWSLNRDRPFPNTAAYNPDASPAFSTASRYSPSQDSALVSVSGSTSTITYPLNPPASPSVRTVKAVLIYHNLGPAGYGGDFLVDPVTRKISWGWIPKDSPQPVAGSIAPDWSSITITYNRPLEASSAEFLRLNFAPKIIRENQGQDLAYTHLMLGYHSAPSSKANHPKGARFTRPVRSPSRVFAMKTPQIIQMYKP